MYNYIYNNMPHVQYKNHLDTLSYASIQAGDAESWNWKIMEGAGRFEGASASRGVCEEFLNNVDKLIAGRILHEGCPDHVNATLTSCLSLIRHIINFRRTLYY